MQNIITADMGGLARGGLAYGGLLTPQGKILFDFLIHDRPQGGDDGRAFFFDLPAGQAEPFIKRLGFYRLRAKIDIAPADDLAVFAAWPDGEEAPADARPDPRLAALGWRWIAAPGSVATNASCDDWHAHRIALSVPESGVDFDLGEAFPYDAAMDALNGVAFAKGCYIGQEVVSRMQHRGTVRRRVVALAADGQLPEPGADITANSRPIGRLGSSNGLHGIGLARLDRLGAAIAAGATVLAGDIPVVATLPDWATYVWPDSPGGNGD
ncbi:MAG TPA: folate-binding protein [Afifellaceae bacterium]|nr:folate-binding protein [Afifellaceae bacterium]